MKKLAVVFPGQGSQAVGMLADIAKEFSEVEQAFALASDVLGYDLWKLVSEGPATKLDQTQYTQPALLAAGYAVWTIIQRHAKKSFNPVVLAGHSLGEYTALVCANAISYQDAIQLVAARGEYMQEAVPQGQGALAAIVGLDNDVVASVCETTVQPGEVLTPANFNSPGQVVIAGHEAAVKRALVVAKEKGAKLAILLPVSVPSHCELMKPAAEKLAKRLATVTIRVPHIPVISNVDVTVYQTAEQIRDGLVRQLYKPVRWVEIIQQFAAQGVEQVVECGPQKVLSGLIKRTDSKLALTTTNDLNNLQSFLEKTFA